VPQNTVYTIKHACVSDPGAVGRIESLRRRIGQIPVIMEESGAWTINDWQSPKIMLDSKMLVDGKTLEECG